MVHVTPERIVYDTKKAQRLGKNGGTAQAGSDAQVKHRSWTETLYITPRGRLFMVRDGGRRSRYRKGDGDDAKPGRYFKALNKAEALQWSLDAGKKNLFAKLLTIEDEPLADLAKERTGHA